MSVRSDSARRQFQTEERRRSAWRPDLEWLLRVSPCALCVCVCVAQCAIVVLRAKTSLAQWCAPAAVAAALLAAATMAPAEGLRPPTAAPARSLCRSLRTSSSQSESERERERASERQQQQQLCLFSAVSVLSHSPNSVRINSMAGFFQFNLLLIPFYHYYWLPQPTTQKQKLFSILSLVLAKTQTSQD